jgi:hypothetical protein
MSARTILKGKESKSAGVREGVGVAQDDGFVDVCFEVDKVTINVMALAGSPKRFHGDPILGLFGRNAKPDGVWTPEHKSRSVTDTFGGLYPFFHGLLQTIHEAFALERELALRPDDVQLAIAQFIARVIASDPSKYRTALGAPPKDENKKIVVEDNWLQPEFDRRTTSECVLAALIAPNIVWPEHCPNCVVIHVPSCARSA